MARQCGVTIGVERPKARLLECMDLPPETWALLTTDLATTRWRVVPMAHLRAPKLREIVRASGGRFTGCVAFRPTGWSFGRGGGSAGAAGRTIRLSDGISIVEVLSKENPSLLTASHLC